MMMRAFAVTALAFFAFAVSADDVVVGNKANFKELIGKDELTLVKFFAPWCGHCKSMAKDFKEAATALKGKAVLADVDATVEKELAEEYGIRGFPTLKLFSNGEVIADYKGGRKKDDFVKYIERALLPSIIDVTDKDGVTELLKENSGKNVFIGAALDKLQAAFKKLSYSVRDIAPDTVTFAAVSDISLLESAAGDAKVAADNVLLVRDDGTTAVYTGDAEGLDAWVKVGSLPLLGELNRETAGLYTELPKPLVMLFQDPKNKDTKVEDAVKEVSAEMRSEGTLAFVWVNSVDLKSFMEHIGLSKAPGIAIYKFDVDTKYVFEGEEITKDSLSKWIDAFNKGDVQPTIKSEPAPEKNDEPVKVVVGDTWKQYVEDESKDVLIEQYAPWCGHCKKLEPVLVELAKKVANVKTLVIAKMDATANDSPAEYKPRGFPTMHFFPAGKSEGITYSGGRKVEDFIKFFKEHATHKDGLDALDAEDSKDKPAEDSDKKDEL